MEKLKISKYPLLVKVILFYLFIKIVDGFFNTLGTVLFQNTSPLIKTHLANLITYFSAFYQWVTATELKITPLDALFLIITIYLINRVSNRFV